MAAVTLCEAPLAALKNCLRDEFDSVKSSHVGEALAYSMGFNTYAALRAALVGPEEDRPFKLLNSERFRQRLVQLGYADDPEFNFELSITAAPVPGVLTTMDGPDKKPYTTTRERAWRNLMVIAINSALEQDLISLHLHDGGRPKLERQESLMFDFTLPNGLPCRGSVGYGGWDELRISAAVNPLGDKVMSLMADFAAGDAYAYSWLERRTGLWLQHRPHTLKCRKHLLQGLADLVVEPMGYGDRGPFIL